LAGITVTLYSTVTSPAIAAGAPLGNTAVMTTVTDNDGRYRLTPVAAGRYFLRFIAPATLVPTQCNQGNDGGVDSDACQRDLTSTGESVNFVVTANQAVIEWDAGFTQPVTVSGYAYLDQNRNEQRDANEPAMPGVMLMLQRVTASARSSSTATLGANSRRGGGAVARTVTGSDGSYFFTQLVPGHYQLLIDPPAGFSVPGSTVQVLPLLAPGESVSGAAGLITLQPTALDGEPEPTHQLYLPFIQHQ
jgi:Na+-transporting NADH:ubiquinone oxidoreductase subunit NqrB